MSEYAECHSCKQKTAMPIVVYTKATVPGRVSWEPERVIQVKRYACSEDCKQKIKESEQGG